MNDKNTTAVQPANSLSALIALINQLPEGPQRLELEYAAGLKTRPVPSVFKVLAKVNEKTKQGYKVIAIDGAKVQFSGKTAKLIVDDIVNAMVTSGADLNDKDAREMIATSNFVKAVNEALVPVKAESNGQGGSK